MRWPKDQSLHAMLVAILAAFLARLSPDKARVVAYLLRGEVAAPFEALEFGMAERMVARAMTVAYAVPERRVAKLPAVAGDLERRRYSLPAAGAVGRGRGHAPFVSSNP